MKIHLITAFTSPSYVIGFGNSIPWHYVEDLYYFQQKTVGSVCIMGYRTYQSLQKPLRDRLNIVIDRNVHGIVREDGFYFVNTLKRAFYYLLHMFHKKESDVFVIGGAKLYHEALQCITFDTLYITKIYKGYPGDTFFPWKENEIETKYYIKEIFPSTSHFEISYEVWHPKQPSPHKWLNETDNSSNGNV